MADIEMTDTEEAKTAQALRSQALPTQIHGGFCRRLYGLCAFNFKNCLDLTWEAPAQIQRRKRLPLSAMSWIKFIILAIVLEIFGIGVGGIMDLVAFNGRKSFWIWSVPVWMILVVGLLGARLMLTRRGATVLVDLYDLSIFIVLFITLHIYGFQIRGKGDSAYQMLSSVSNLINNPIAASSVSNSDTFFIWLNQLVTTFACGSYSCPVNDGKLLIIAGILIKLNVQQEFSVCYPNQSYVGVTDFLAASECALTRGWAKELTFPSNLNIRYTDGYFQGSYGPWQAPETVGEMETYPPSGFEMTLDQNYSLASEQVQLLQNAALLMKPETRVAFIEFPVFSIVLGRWIYIREIFEMSVSGAWIHSEQLLTGLMPRTGNSLPSGWPSPLAPLPHPQTLQFLWSLSFLLIMCEITEAVVVGWTLALQIKHVVWYGLVLILFILLSLTLAAQTYIVASFPVHLEYVATSSYFFKLTVYISLASLCLWLMCLKYLNWLPGLGIVTKTMRQSAPDLAVLAVATMLMIGGFTFLLHFAWGEQVYAFSSLKQSLFTILQAFTGGLDTSDMPAQDYAAFCYVLFMLLITFFALTMLIAVISDAFVVVQSEEREKVRELQEKNREWKLSLEQWLAKPPTTHSEGCFGTVNLVIWRAEDIQSDVVPSMFVETSIHGADNTVQPLVCRTTVVQNSLQPQWQQKFVLPIRSEGCKIKFALHDSLQDNTLLGEDSVDVSSLVPEVVSTLRLDIMSAQVNGRGRVTVADALSTQQAQVVAEHQGFVVVSLCFYPQEQVTTTCS